MEKRTEEKVRNYIKEHHMIEEGDRIIAGVSGGADSVALFCLLEKLRIRMNFSMRVVHINHRLRGEEAERDADFVENLCREYQVEYVLYSRDVGEIASARRLGLEEAGRQVRMEVFDQELKQWQGTKLALAHHQNDQAETMLHHLSRGSGLRGLRGMLPCQGKKIRPLMCLDREEIVHYLEELGQEYVMDSSNFSEDYTRNRIRHQILPVLTGEVNEKAVLHMAQAAEHLRKVDKYLTRHAREVLGNFMYKSGEDADTEGEEIHLKEGFFEEEEILKEQALMLLLEEEYGGRRDITAGHIHQILELSVKPVGRQLELPGGVFMERQYDGILCRRKKPSVAKREVLETELKPGAVLNLSSGRILARILPYFGQEIPEKTYTKWLNYDKMSSTVQIRTRRPGDYLVVNGNGGRKKLKDYFIDCKIPQRLRDNILLVAAGSEILWVVGYRINEAYRVEKDTKMILEIQYEGGGSDGRENQRADQ